jgi:hypothetical protein
MLTGIFGMQDGSKFSEQTVLVRCGRSREARSASRRGLEEAGGEDFSPMKTACLSGDLDTVVKCVEK